MDRDGLPFGDTDASSPDALAGTLPLGLRAPQLTVGAVVAKRFVIERFAGAGGMASVYRAKDLSTDLTVALKVIGKRRADSEERFLREAQLLSQVSHPAVVRYIAHGLSDEGLPYLAIEWLSGEDLATRTSRAGLTVEESLALLRRVAAGLSAVHQRGITHRDITPGNIFLVDGRADLATLLDFGVARQRGGVRTLTMVGTAIGTIGYMAPEQAMGMHDVDARADVFSLGCVLFECLTGVPAFAGPQDIAVLARVLRDDAPRLRELRPELDARLDALVASMLAKERSERPRDAAALLPVLEELGSLAGPAAPSQRAHASDALAEAEQRIASVVIARPQQPAPTTLAASASDVEAAQLEELVQHFGAQPVPLRAGQLLLVFGGSEGIIASDQAVQAVRCALRLRALRPDLEIGVATGGLEAAFNVSVGVAIDRAAALLERAREPADSIRLDDLTAGLVAGRFRVRREGSDAHVVVGTEALERPRLLLGEPTPCVGRDKELRLLEATLAECSDDGVARVVLVTAQAGTGKSRLGREFSERVRGQGSARILVAHADPLSVRSALNVVQRLLSQAFGLREGDPPARRHARLHEALTHLIVDDASTLAWLGEFLGELVGAPSPKEPSPLLRAARGEPTVMREQTRRAVQRWLSAELAQRPLVILLEDLQWADLPSVTYLEESLRALEEQPLFVLALARPEVHDHFPQLFRQAGIQEIRLLGLTRRAAERLAREVLPASVDASLIERVVSLADGNAFYLEELIRQVAEGATELPETVRAIMQSRLERLEPEARRHLRAASVFGETCWVGGVSALLGGSSDVASWFERLSREELFVQRREARFPGEVEYVFRHALLRDAAYAMFTDGARRSAHELAGEWLQEAGERDPCVLADHYERGNAPVRAISWLLQAARGALGSDDFDAAVALAQRALRLEGGGRERGELLLVQGHASASGTHTHLELAQEALSLLPRASGSWWFALALMVFGASASGRSELAEPYLELASATAPPLGERSGGYGQAFEVLALGAVLVGRVDIGWSVLSKFEQWATGANDYVSLGWLNTTRCQLATNTSRAGVWQLERAVHAGREAVNSMRAAGAVSGEATALLHLGIALREAGCYEQAEQAFRECHHKATEVRNVLVAEFSAMMLAVFALRRGERALGLAQLDQLAGSSDQNLVQACEVVRAEVSLRSGELDQATLHGRRALTGPGLMHRVAAGLTLARAELTHGHVAEALTLLEAARAGRASDSFPQFELDLLALRAEVFRKLDDPARAAREELAATSFAERTLAGLSDEALRRAFVKRLPRGARTSDMTAERAS